MSSRGPLVLALALVRRNSKASEAASAPWSLRVGNGDGYGFVRCCS